MQNLTPINENAFIGMNNRYPGHLLPRGVFRNLSNVLISESSIDKRPGTTGSTSVATGQVMLGGTAFEPNGGNKAQVFNLNGATNARLYYSTNATTFSTLGSANLTKDAQMNFLQASNYLFGFNGFDEIDLASDGVTLTHNRATVPLGTVAFWFHNYLFVAGVAGNPSRLYWSNLGDPTTFTSTNFIDINANDGDKITGLTAFNDNLVVTKLNSIWQITGFSGSTFSATTVAGQNTQNFIQGYGSPSHQSLVAAGSSLYYLSFIGGIPHIRAMKRTLYGTIVDGGIMSLDIEQTMKGLNFSKLNLAAGFYDGKYLYWALPSGSSQVNDTVICFYPELATRGPDGVIRSWTVWTGINVNQFFVSTLSGQGKTYFSDAGTTGKVFVIDSSVAADNGTPVVMTADYRDFILDRSAARKAKWKYLYTKFKTGSAGTLGVYARLDEAADFTLQESIALKGNSPGLGPTGTFTLGVSQLGGQALTKQRVTLAQMTGTLLGVRLLESTANPCSVYELEAFGFLKGLRDD